MKTQLLVQPLGEKQTYCNIKVSLTEEDIEQIREAQKVLHKYTYEYFEWDEMGGKGHSGIEEVVLPLLVAILAETKKEK
jgi:hypothetical protein